MRILGVVPQGGSTGGPETSIAPYALYSIGHGSPLALMDFIRAIETATGCEAQCDFQPMQPGDVPRTWADTEALFQATGYRPRVSVEEGVQRFVDWYREFYHV